MKIFNKLLMILVGGLFIFSGLIKINDPVGTQIKLEEYFEVFADDLRDHPDKVVINGEEQAVDASKIKETTMSKFFEGLKPYALYFSLFMCAFEIILGTNLLLGYKISATLWAFFAMVIFFTFLTFYSFWYDKVTDCGCFGDAIKLTPKESFLKDVILTVLLSYLLLQRKKLTALLSNNIGLIGMVLATLISFGIGIYAINFLPPIDFRAYKIGANIAKEMKPSSPLQYGKDQYTFLNLTTQEEEVFDDWTDELDDSLKYKYISYEKPLLNPEAQAKITDFSIWNDKGDFTQKTLKGKKLLILMYDIKHADQSTLEALSKRLAEYQKGKVEALIISAASLENMEALRHQYQLNIPVYAADKKVIKTIARSNPAFLWMENGTILGKWHYHRMPKVEDLK